MTFWPHSQAEIRSRTLRKLCAAGAERVAGPSELWGGRRGAERVAGPSALRRTDERCPRTAFVRGFFGLNRVRRTGELGKRLSVAQCTFENPRTKAVRGHEAHCGSRADATLHNLPSRRTPQQNPRRFPGGPAITQPLELHLFSSCGSNPLWSRRRAASFPESPRQRKARRPQPPRFFIAALPASYFSQYSVPSFVRPMKP